MSTEKPQKISIGFHGGQVLAARVSSAELTKLRGCLSGGESWTELVAEDGTLVLDARRVDYLLVESDEHRIGF